MELPFYIFFAAKYFIPAIRNQMLLSITVIYNIDIVTVNNKCSQVFSLKQNSILDFQVTYLLI